MEGLIHQHSYARSPLRAYSDKELEDLMRSQYSLQTRGNLY